MSGLGRRIAFAERVYAWLLYLYPSAFRERFAVDMRELFRDQLHAVQVRGNGLAVARLWTRTLSALLRTALLERADEFSRAIPSQQPISPKKDGIVQNLTMDLRYAVRMLRKSPVFTAVAVLVIALGTGAVTTIFSAANAIVLRPLPGATRTEQLVDIDRSQADGQGSLSASYPYYRRLQDASRNFEDVAAWTMVPLTISTGGEGIASLGNIVSGNYFRVLGVRPALGRFFVAEEDSTQGTHPVVVVGHAFWQSRLNGDSAVVGRTISLNGHPFTVIGVAPPRFQGIYAPLKTDAWVPLMMQQVLRPGGDLTRPGNAWLEMFGRLRDGATREGAQAELAALTRAQIADAAEPKAFGKYSGVHLSTLTGLPSEVGGAVLGFMVLLLAAAGVVLMIASVNVAAMLLARTAARRREMALRVALGAGRWRLVRQMLTENVLLFLVGAAGGVLLAVQASHALEQIPLPVDMPLALDLSPDLRVLTFALVVSLLTGVVFGLAPAMQASRVDLGARMRDNTAGSGARHSRTRSVLVIGQMALSLLLLVAAGLFLRALDRGQRVDPGIDTNNVAVAAFDVRTYGYDDTRGRQFYQTLKEQLSAVPGVTAVSYTHFLPLSMTNTGDEIQVDGAEPLAGDVDRGFSISLAQVDVDYFSVVRMPVLRGRSFASTDDARAPKVALVNETLAKRFWPNGDAVGRTFRLDHEVVTIVGLARDAKYSTLNEEPTPFAYFPLSQNWQSAQNLMVRTSGDPARFATTIRSTVRALDPMLPVPVVTTLRLATSVVLLPQRVAAIVTGVLGLLGLVLAAVGLYGIIAYSVSQRTREIGIRVALGARRADVVQLVVREGMRLVAIGMAIGLVLALTVTRVMTKFLFNVSPVDAITFVGGAALLTGVAFAASYLPARRAAATDPMSALRFD
ncbi:MAG: ABC transporter permease [Gemmatimonadaceae bacterium]